MPWFNLHVATDGNIAPCCEYDGAVGRLDAQTLDDAWNGEQLAMIRRRFAAGDDVEGCWKCFEREAAGKASLRQEKNKAYPAWMTALEQSEQLDQSAPPAPAGYDIRFSNICNFTCRSCWHGASSKWFKDGQAIGVTAADQAVVRSFSSSEDAIEQLETRLGAVEQMYFAGGEPLIIPEHFQLLKLLVERGRTDVALSYTTNMSVTRFKGESIFALWRRFPKLDVQASVDAVGEKGALIRKGFRWDRFVANIQELRQICPHAIIRFGITVSAFNILSLPDLFEALQIECGAGLCDLEIHPLQEPEHYRSQVLPPALKHVAAEKLSAFAETCAGQDPGGDQLAEAIRGEINYMFAEDRSHDLPTLKRALSRLDALRSEDSLAVLPELSPAFDGLP